MKTSKFDNIHLKCSTCKTNVTFDLIGDVECDWGSHVIIQCTNCEELFSIDQECPAFTSLLDLNKLNENLLNQQEKLDYISKSHQI